MKKYKIISVILHIAIIAIIVNIVKPNFWEQRISVRPHDWIFLLFVIVIILLVKLFTFTDTEEDQKGLKVTIANALLYEKLIITLLVMVLLLFSTGDAGGNKNLSGKEDTPRIIPISENVKETIPVDTTDSHDDRKTNQKSSQPFHQFEKLEKEYIENYDYVYIGKYVKNIGFIDTRLTAEDGSAVDPENLPKILVTAEGTTTRFKAKLDSPNRKGFQYEYIGFITIDNSMCTLVSDVGSDTSEIWVRFFDIKIKERSIHGNVKEEEKRKKALEGVKAELDKLNY